MTRVKLGVTDQSEYLYTGLGQLIRTDVLVPAVYCTRAGASANSYDNLDRFNRVVSDIWHGGSGSKDFYDVDITYGTGATDAASIKHQVDNVLTGFDVEYTLDGQDRLTKAEEGTWSGSAITSRKRQQDWTLTQLGYWYDFNHDMTGTQAFATGTDDYKSRNTFNKANECRPSTPGHRRTIDKNLADHAARRTSTARCRGELTDEKQFYVRVRRLNRLVSVESVQHVLAGLYNGLGRPIGGERAPATPRPRFDVL
jgi:hypothetical protein